MMQLATFAAEVHAILATELSKLRRDPTDIVTRSVQPVLWLLVFGQVLGRSRAIPTGGTSYLAFMAPGILAQSVLFMAIFYGIAVIWERDLGVLHKILVSPAHRSALVLGKGLSAGLRGLAQATIVYLLALAIHVHPRVEPLPLLGVAACVVLGSALFSTFSLIIACIVKTRERFMGIGQVLTMPLFFASNAIYPLALMPHWLRVISRGNPLSYLVDALRTFMIGTPSQFGLWLDFAVLAGVLLGLTALAARMFPALVR
ncbi:MAG: ABC transporter permease [Deltaproteobacteria bacterium]|nr:ABC transporter permease [Deltaproteobacteria bacterium]